MEFLLYERKFKLIGEDLFSFYKYGTSKTEKWHLVKLHLDKGYKRFSFIHKGKTKHFRFHRAVYLANNPQFNIYDTSMENFIDHIDCVKTNNNISNLRVVTNQENQWNTKCKGYTFDKEKGKYKAQITLNNKSIHIGFYDTEDEAHQAYLNKKKELHKIQAR